MKNYPDCGFFAHLSHNRDLPKYKEGGDIVFTCPSIIKDSTNRHRSEEITYEGKPRSSHEALLVLLGLEEQPNNIARVMGESGA